MTPSSHPEAPALLLLPRAEQGPAQLLFVLLHGVGSNAASLQGLAQALHAQYPQAAVLALNGPAPFDAVPGGGTGYQWFSVSGISEANRPERVAAALPGLIQRVRAWQAHFDLPWERVALAGFSQGAIMALEAVQAEAQFAGRVLAFSGRYASLPTHAPQDVSLHLLHGLEDQVLPYGPAVEAAKALVQLGADVTADVLPDIGHELHPTLLAKALHQLRTFVPAKLWREAMKTAQEQGLAPPPN